MCTSLIYRDAADKVYLGRTLELTTELPYQIVFFPKALEYKSHIEGHPSLEFTGKYSFIGITMPGRMPSAEQPLTYLDLKSLEGMNDQGMTFSLLSYPAAGGKHQALETTTAVLSASDLGSWALSQFATVNEVKAALERIEGGTYGICDECGDEIGDKRLEGRPVTTLCIDCKTKQENVEKTQAG